MDINRLTQKAQEALGSAHSKAARYGHQQVDVEHLLAALLEQDGGLAISILEKLSIDSAALKRRLDQELERMPRVSGGGASADQIYVTGRLNRLLAEAEQEAKNLKDEYVSIEHILLAMSGDSGAAGRILKEFGVTREPLTRALKEVRGNQRVTSQNPEATYEALAKYGRDFTKLAAQGKLDPVIGRDEEIRRVIQVLSRRSKNNPVLIGDPGVGKTAIVGGLGAAYRPRRRAGEPQKQASDRAGHGRAHRRSQVPRRIRRAAQGRAQRSPGISGRDYSFHRRAAHGGRRGRGGRRHGCVQSAETDAGARRAALHRRDDLG